MGQVRKRLTYANVVSSIANIKIGSPTCPAPAVEVQAFNAGQPQAAVFYIVLYN